MGARNPIERPRERMLMLGAEALSDIELLALLLGGGRSIERATTLLDSLGGLTGLASATCQELARVPGVGDASSTAIRAGLELARRIVQLELPYAAALRKPSDVATYVRALLRGEPQEHFVVLGLDARQRVRLVKRVAVGTLAHVDVHPREVFRPLLRAGMHSVIVVHNHPSGDAEPSDADLMLTRRLADIGRLVGIPVLDHLVVTDKDAISLANMGLVPG